MWRLKYWLIWSHSCLRIRFFTARELFLRRAAIGPISESLALGTLDTQPSALDLWHGASYSHFIFIGRARQPTAYRTETGAS